DGLGDLLLGLPHALHDLSWARQLAHHLPGFHGGGRGLHDFHDVVLDWRNYPKGPRRRDFSSQASTPAPRELTRNENLPLRSAQYRFTALPALWPHRRRKRS